MRRGALPALLFLLATGGTIYLGSRILVSERTSAERTARERLRSRAREAAGILVTEANRLMREALTGTPDAIRRADGVFLKPAERLALAPIALSPERDSEASFYLAEAERAEAADRDLDRAAGLYRAAAGEAHDRDHRLVALFRLAALERRRGNEFEVSKWEIAFVTLLPSELRGTLEALVVRVRRPMGDRDLRQDLLLRIGGEDEGVVQGLLASAKLLPGPDLDARRDEVRLMTLVRSSTAFSWPHGGGGNGFTKVGAQIVDGRILAFALPSGGPDRFRLGNRLSLPAGTTFDSPNPDTYGIVEFADVGDPLPGIRIRACEPLSTIEAEARRGAWMLGGALAALVLAGGAALFHSVRAARMETEAARARADFVTKVGHDLRTPLAVVRMYAETLAAGRVADPAEAREFAGVAAREAGRLTGMVDQVLDLSRVAAPAVPRAPLDLAALAADVAAVHRPLFEHAGIRFEVRAEARLPVLGDSASLRGAVSNLLENAQRHGGPGGSVEIEAARDGTMAVVRVLDRGPGLPAGMEERIFERFVRGPEAAGSGAGLGLALVREAAEAHGGTARASHREGGGAVFTVSVPTAEEAA